MSADNYDEFLKALNVGFLLRKVGDFQKFRFPPQKGRQLSKVSVSSSERYAALKSLSFLLGKVGSTEFEKVKKNS